MEVVAAQLPPHIGGQWGIIGVAGQDSLLAGSAVARRLPQVQRYRKCPGKAALSGSTKRLGRRSHTGPFGGSSTVLPLLQKELVHGKSCIAALGRHLARHAQQRGKH